MEINDQMKMLNFPVLYLGNVINHWIDYIFTFIYSFTLKSEFNTATFFVTNKKWTDGKS